MRLTRDMVSSYANRFTEILEQNNIRDTSDIAESCDIDPGGELRFPMGSADYVTFEDTSDPAWPQYKMVYHLSKSQDLFEIDIAPNINLANIRIRACFDLDGYEGRSPQDDYGNRQQDKAISGESIARIYEEIDLLSRLLESA